MKTKDELLIEFVEKETGMSFEKVWYLSSRYENTVKFKLFVFNYYCTELINEIWKTLHNLIK
jgi:hypothetical protein